MESYTQDAKRAIQLAYAHLGAALEAIEQAANELPAFEAGAAGILREELDRALRRARNRYRYVWAGSDG